MFIQVHIFVHFHIFKETNPQWKFISAIEDYIEYFALNVLYICVLYTFWAANYICNLLRYQTLFCNSVSVKEHSKDPCSVLPVVISSA